MIAETPRQVNEASETTQRISLYDRLHLKIISLIHDTMYSVFVDPYVWLNSAGLKPGLTALEVGCGPGFFTVPAARILGNTGHFYTIDINPAAVQHVRRKVERSGLTSVEIFHADAVKTGLRCESIDVAFLFGILHSLKDLNAVLLEMHRVLRKSGTLAVEKSRSESSLMKSFTKDGLFHFVGKGSNIYRFEKREVTVKP